MNNISRRTAFENEIAMRNFPSKSMGQPPALTSKTHALADVKNLCRPASVSAKTAAIERQRLNAEKLSKGYSVVGKGKENAVKQSSVKAVGKENAPVLQSRVSVAPSARSTLQGFKSSSFRSTLSVRPDQSLGGFRVPTKPAKQKKTDGITKSESVTCLPSIVVQEAEKPEVEEVVASLEALFVDDDKINENDEFLLGNYAKDIYRYLKSLEQAQSVRSDYLTKKHIMTETMRAMLVDWMYEVQQSFDLLQDTAQMAVALLDRFMQDSPKVPKEDLQLVGVTCIFIASKYEEMYPPSVTELVQVSAEACSKSQILRMEQRIMRSLEFNIGRPPPVQFLRRYSRIAGVNSVTYATSKYISDLALVQYAFAHLPPSVLAAASLHLAMFLNADSPPYEKVWTPKLVFFTEYSAKDLHATIIELAKLVTGIPNLKQKCVQEMYSHHKKHHGVSLRSELKDDKIRQLAVRS